MEKPFALERFLLRTLSRPNSWERMRAWVNFSPVGASLRTIALGMTRFSVGILRLRFALRFWCLEFEAFGNGRIGWSDCSAGYNEFHTLADSHVQHLNVFLPHHHEESAGGVRGCGDEDVLEELLGFVLDLAFAVAGEEAEGVAAVSRELDKHDFLENGFVLRAEGVDDLFYGRVDGVDDGYGVEEAFADGEEVFGDEVAGEVAK